MKAIAVEPKVAGSAKRMDFPEPDLHEGTILVEAVAVGVCGTDVEIAEGKYGWAPPGQSHLILGHESLGRVIDPGTSGGFKKGDLVKIFAENGDFIGIGKARYNSEKLENEKKAEKQKPIIHYDYLYLETSRATKS